MKYKKLTKEQIIISLDRLTRFKNTKEKYLRVFSDIIISNLIEPKLRKSDIEKMDYEEIASITEEIFNNSLENNKAENAEINNYLKNYENSVFNNDNETQKLLNNKINYVEAIKYIPDDCPINLKWLKILSSDSLGNTVILSKSEESLKLKENREKQLLKYPLEEILLVEGITEEILLPIFSKYLGYDFDAKGIQIIAAGGKNQVVKMYYKLAEEIKLPIFVLLDKDAEDNIKQIEPKLRQYDRIHLVSCGEFEDLLPKSLIVKTINSHFKNFLKIAETDLKSEYPTAKVLEEIFKTKGLHEFKKAEFANSINNLLKPSDKNFLSDEIKAIIEEIKN